MQLLLELENISKSYQNKQALKPLSLSIPRGSVYGLLGPNGAGKTTLIRIITHITGPDTGTMRFNGKPGHPDDVRRMGYMPEERGLDKKMTVWDQLLFFARLKGLSGAEAEKRIVHWLRKLEMVDWAKKKVEELSKGMAQKVQFIATVIHEPEFLILDEPFSGLDPVNANLIKDEIFNLAKAGATIIFSTHRMEQVEEICDQIILVNKGTKILDGTVSQVKQDFKENIFEIGFDQSVLPEHTAIHLFNLKSAEDKKLRIQINEGFTNNDVLQFFIQQGLNIRSFHEVLPSLNDIFIKLVQGTPEARQFQH